MSDGIVCPIGGVAHPGAALRKRLGHLYGHEQVQSLETAIDDLVSVDAFARLLTEGIEKTLAKDGRLDTKDLAAFVLRRMKENAR